MRKDILTSWLFNPDLLLYLPFREASGDTVYDLSGHEKNGTIYGPTWEHDPIIGWALKFDGIDDYVETPSLSFVSFSIELIVKIASYKKYSGVGSKYWIGSGGCYALTLGSDIYFELVIKDFAGYDHRVVSKIKEVGKWYHVVGTFEEGKGLKIFVDGKEEGFTELTDKGLFSAIDVPFTIGARDWTYGPFYFDGLIALVRVYNRALSCEEVKTLYDYYVERSVFELLSNKKQAYLV